MSFVAETFAGLSTLGKIGAAISTAATVADVTVGVIGAVQTARDAERTADIEAREAAADTERRRSALRRRLRAERGTQRALFGASGGEQPLLVELESLSESRRQLEDVLISGRREVRDVKRRGRIRSRAAQRQGFQSVLGGATRIGSLATTLGTP